MKNTNDLDNAIILYGLNYQDLNKNSFLHHFSRTGNMKLIKHLMTKSKLNINIIDDLGRSALFYSFDEEIAEFLFKYKIDYEIKDIQGQKAEDLNKHVHFIIGKRCNQLIMKIMKMVYWS